MKKYLLISLSLIALLSSCSTEEEVSRSSFMSLSFETFVGKGTSTRVSSRTDFAEGDNFGVIAYRHGADPWADGVTKKLFMDNVKVTRQGGEWTYAPTRYWEEGVNHTFLAYSPYNEDYMLNGQQLVNIATADAVSAQVDLLYSIPDVGSKDLVWAEGQKVVMTFRHALSQIRLSASTDQDYTGYYGVTIRKVELAGIQNMGTLNLDASDVSVSPWNYQGSSGGYVAHTADLTVALSTEETLLNAGDNLFMQMPQEIPDAETASFKITYDIVATEAGNASNSRNGLVTTVPIPAITWEHNRIYHYKIQMNLLQLLGLKSIEVGEPDVVEWETGGEIKLPADLTVTIVPTTSGDTEQEGTGSATLGITKSNAAGQIQAIKIVNPEKNDQWIVEVGPELTDDAAVATLAEKKEPASWLKVSKGTGKADASKLYGKEDAEIQIKIVEANTSAQSRKAEVTIRRALSGVTRIVVTQEEAPAAIIEANSTQFPMEGRSNQLTIINPASSSAWSLSLSEGADTWLSLQDEDGNPVTQGTAGQVVNAVAAANHTASVRTATITLTREAQEPVLVEVTQAAPEPMSVSATDFSFSYLAGSQTLTITNPEAGKEGFTWTLAGTSPDWLTVSPTAGTTDKTGKLTFTTLLNTASIARTPAAFTLQRVGQADIPITVSQEGAPVTVLSATALTATYAAQTKTFNVTSPAGIPWSLANSAASWIEASPASGSGNATVNLVLKANTSSTASRGGIVTLTRDGQSPLVLTVTQEATPAQKTTVSPTNIKGVPSSSWSSTITVTAAPGMTWTATVDAPTFGLYPYLFINTKGTKQITQTGSATFKLITPGLPSTGSYIGIVYIKDEQGKTAITIALAA